MSSRPLVSIIILNYNGKRYIDAALDSIAKTDYENFEVILVDNASEDGSVDYVKRTFDRMSNLKIVENDGNYGFARGNNLGIPHADGHSEYLVFLNNDVFVEAKWLSRLVETMETNPQAGALQCKVLLASDRKTIDSAGHFLDFLGYTYQRGEDETDNGQYEKLIDISYPYGAAFMIRKCILNPIATNGELFDSSYFCYHEDSDLGLRIRLRGFSILYVPSSVVYHVKGGSGLRYDVKAQTSSLNIVFYLTRNRITTLIKNYSATNLARFLPALLSLEISRAILVLPSLPRHSTATFKAIFHVLRNLKQILNKRSVVQNCIRKESDARVLRFMLKPDLMYNVRKFRKYVHRAE